MGEDLSNGARIGVTIIILCAVVAIVLALLMIMKNITNSGSSQLQNGLDQMLATRFDDYDQRNVSGTEVLSAIKLFEGQPVGIVVLTMADADGKQDTAGVKAVGGRNYGALLCKYGDATIGQADPTGKDTPNGNGKQFPLETALVTSGSDGTATVGKAVSTDSFWTINLFTNNSGALCYNMNTRPLTVSGTPEYVRKSAKFLAELIRDTTGTTVGIIFKQIT
jgi:hypothetical protein